MVVVAVGGDIKTITSSPRCRSTLVDIWDGASPFAPKPDKAQGKVRAWLLIFCQGVVSPLSGRKCKSEILDQRKHIQRRV